MATECEFIYLFVGPKTCHTFFLKTSLPIYNISVVYYITCKDLILSLPSINFLSVIPFHPKVWPIICDLRKMALQLTALTVTLNIMTMIVFTNDRVEWYVRMTSPGLIACCSFSTDTSHDQASCSFKMALLLGLGVWEWPRLYLSCCMPWAFFSCTVQQTETTT